jgi:tyrosine-specific transport protein
MMNAKLIGGILLIAGTCIGGGMLGLPIATSQGGILASSLLFIACWILMCFTALLTLEVNLCFPRNSNVISMARATLGKPAEFLCWTVYLFFLYALVSAYIAGGQDVLRGLLQSVGIEWPAWLAGSVFVLVFGAIVTLGTKHVDLFNRLMMFVKFGSLFVLMTLIANHVHIQNYSSGQAHYLLPALTVVVTSFGFSIIVPSMRAYFHNDIKQVRMAILVGSFIPLLCYLAWEAVIVGAIPLEGDTGLARLMQSAEPVTSLVQSISFYIPADVVVILTKLFTSICILTAFVCVSLGLADYLADGFSVEKQGLNNIIVSLFTFIPPLIIAVFYPRAFILFLSIAGLCCVLLQALMPAMMAWRVRYHQKREMTYQVIGGKPALLLAMMASTVIMAVSGYYLLMGVS